MESTRKSSNKIREIVRLQQIVKRWKKLANNNNKMKSNDNSSSSGSLKFLKKTLSFSESGVDNNNVVPKGYIAVCVGKELKRFVVPMEYLSHQAFGVLLREAEEEFGFQQQGVLKIPCRVDLFEKMLKLIKNDDDSNKNNYEEDLNFARNINNNGYSYPSGLTPSLHHPQLC